MPKYLADAFDGKVLWLLTGEEETRAKFQYGEEPPAEQYDKDSQLHSSCQPHTYYDGRSL